MRQGTRSQSIDTRVPAIGCDPLERQAQILLPKRCDRKQRLEEPPDAPRQRALVNESPTGEGAGVEEEGGSGVGDLDAGAFGELFEEAEERDLVVAQAGLVVVGTDLIDL